jgi:hypothetical protein
VNNLDLLIPTQERSTDSWLWATVTQVGPLRVRLDGDETSLPITPENLAYGLEVGMRVWVQLSGRRVIVHSQVEGAQPPKLALHQNPGFEVPYQAGANTPLGWTTFWASSDVQFSFDFNDYVEGTRSVKMVAPSGSNPRFHGNVVIGVSPSAVITFTFWAKASTAGVMQMGLMSQNDGNPDFFNGREDLVQQYQDIAVGTVWSKHRATFSVPAGHTVARFTMVAKTDDGVSRTWWIDASESEMIIAPAAPMPSHSHPTPRFNAEHTYASSIGGGGSWANGSIVTVGIWEPGPTWPSTATAAHIALNVNARSDTNAAGYWEMLFNTGYGWERLGFQRVHNNGSSLTQLGFAGSSILDRDRTALGDCRVALNVHIDGGGGWFAIGPTSCQISFLHNA